MYRSNPQTKPARWLNSRMWLIASLLSLALAACGGEGSGSVNRLRDAVNGGTAQPTPQTQTQTQPAQVIEVTRIVEIEQPAQVIESTRVVEVPATVVVVVTATPDIQGFSAPAESVPQVDESVQPCPVIYWRGGRCTATQAQLDAYASEVQP